MNIEITGINIVSAPTWDRPLAIAAFFDVRLPDISTTLRGCALALSRKSWIALPPKVPGIKSAGANAIKWDAAASFPSALCEAALDRYKAFGGSMPPKAVAIERLRETYDVVEAGGMTLIGLPKQQGRYVYERIEQEADDSEAVAGLARTLSVEHQEAARVLG